MQVHRFGRFTRASLGASGDVSPTTQTPRAFVGFGAPAIIATLLVAGCASHVSPTAPDASAIEAELSDAQLVVRAESIAWSACPPTLPAECTMAVLEGDPKRETLFTARFRIPGTLEMKPHWHPRNERVTVLEGRVGVGFGDELDREKVTWFGPGDYYVNARGAHHFVLTDGPALLQVTGIGPWEVNYLERD